MSSVTVYAKPRPTNWADALPFFPVDAPLAYSMKGERRALAVTRRNPWLQQVRVRMDDAARDLVTWDLSLDGTPEEIQRVRRHFDLARGRFGVFPFVEPVAASPGQLYEAREDAGGLLAWAPFGDSIYGGTDGAADFYNDGIEKVAVSPWITSVGYNLLLGQTLDTCADVLDWDATGLAALRDSQAVALRGDQSVEVVCPGTASGEGLALTQTNYPAVTATLGYTWSAWVYSPTGGDVRAEILWKDAGFGDTGTENGSTVTLAAGEWTKISVTGTAPALTAWARCRIRTPSAQALTFYVGSAQFQHGTIPGSHAPPGYGTWTFETSFMSNLRLASTGHRIVMVRYDQDELSVRHISYNREQVSIQLVEAL